MQFGLSGMIAVALNTAMALFVVAGASFLRQRLAARPSLLQRLRRGSAMILGGLGLLLLLTRRPA